MDGPTIAVGAAEGSGSGTARSTATSAQEGRLKVDAGARSGRKAVLKRKIKNSMLK